MPNKKIHFKLKNEIGQVICDTSCKTMFRIELRRQCCLDCQEEAQEFILDDDKYIDKLLQTDCGTNLLVMKYEK